MDMYDYIVKLITINEQARALVETAQETIKKNNDVIREILNYERGKHE